MIFNILKINMKIIGNQLIKFHLHLFQFVYLLKILIQKNHLKLENALSNLDFVNDYKIEKV